MSAEVVVLPGVDRPSQTSLDQPVPELIEMLESFLTSARRGELRACAVAAVRSGNVCSEGWKIGRGGYVHTLMAAISYLQQRYAESVNAGSYDHIEPEYGPDAS